MVSSQAACLNLFLPILRDKKVANEILPIINSQFKELAIDHLEDGFKFDYFDTDNTAMSAIICYNLTNLING